MWFLFVVICRSWCFFSVCLILIVKIFICLVFSSEVCLVMWFCDMLFVSMMSICLWLWCLCFLNKYFLVKVSVLLMYVFFCGYWMLLMVCCMCVIVFSWLNWNSGMGFVEKRIVLMCDWVFEMGSVMIMDLMKLSISLKLLWLWYLMFLELLIRNVRFIIVL